MRPKLARWRFRCLALALGIGLPLLIAELAAGLGEAEALEKLRALGYVK